NGLDEASCLAKVLCYQIGRGVSRFLVVLAQNISDARMKTLAVASEQGVVNRLADHHMRESYALKRAEARSFDQTLSGKDFDCIDNLGANVVRHHLLKQAQ